MIKKIKNVNEGKRSDKLFNVVTPLEILMLIFHPNLLLMKMLLNVFRLDLHSRNILRLMYLK